MAGDRSDGGEARSLGMSRGEPTAPVHYHVQAGTLRQSGAAE